MRLSENRGSFDMNPAQDQLWRSPMLGKMGLGSFAGLVGGYK
jgi:hypothetical protein